MPIRMHARPDTTEGGWAVDELDPATRDRAVAAAAALGLDLSEYLSQLMLALAIEDQGVRAADDDWRLRELQNAYAARFASLENRIDAAARGASEADALTRQTLAQQLETFSNDVDSRLEAALAELRAADLAAGRTDAAAAALAEDMRCWRAGVDAQLADAASAAQFGLAEAQARIDDLANAVSAGDATMRTAVRELETQVADAADVASAAAGDVRALHERLSDFDSQLQEVKTEVSALAASTGATAADFDARLSALARTVSANAEQTGEDVRTLAAETERVESSMLVSLSKLADDIAGIRRQQETARAEPRAWESTVDERLARLEAAAETAVSSHAVEALRLQLAELRAHIVRRDADDKLARRVDELTSRLAASEAANAAAFARLHDAIRAAEADRQTTTVTSDRVSAVELALSKLAERIERRPDEDGAGLRAVETRMAAIEAAQATALDALHAQLALFIDAVNRRMDALEASNAAAGLGEITAAFDTFRAQIDDRIGYIETHSIRALQRVAETVSVLEGRFGASDRKSA